MSFTDNLQSFNDQIEDAISNIPEEDILKDPNIFRLVKLLSWSKLASGSVGGGGGSTGGGGGVSRGELSSELQDLETELVDIGVDIESLIANVSSIAKQDTIIEKLELLIDGQDFDTTETENLLSSIETELEEIRAFNSSISNRTSLIVNVLSRIEGAFPEQFNKCLPVDVEYLTTDTTKILIRNFGYDSIKALSFSLTSPCKVELFISSQKIAVFRDARSVNMEFPKWIDQGNGVDVTLTGNTEKVFISGYALLNLNNFGG